MDCGLNSNKRIQFLRCVTSEKDVDRDWLNQTFVISDQTHKHFASYTYTLLTILTI